MKERTAKILKGMQIIFYLCSVFLWFKDNFALTRKINISFLIPFVLFIFITLARLYFRLRKSKPKFTLKFDKSILAVLFIIIIIMTFRIPYLAYNFGLMDSDAGVSALMGKHISEGKTPPLLWYGHYHDGSLSAHYYALIFKIFGYSILSLKASVVMLFLGFVGIQFILLKKIFNLSYALLVCLFYALPVGHVIASSFESATSHPTVLFLGSLIIYLSYLIHYENKSGLIPALGFLMGLGFWSQQVIIYFILVSLILLILRFRLELKKYLILVFYALIGAFPLIFNEIFSNFNTMKYLFGGSSGSILSWAKVKKTVDSVSLLFVDKINFFNYIYFILILLSLGVSIYAAVKRKSLAAQNIHVLFFILVLAVYMFSKFGEPGLPTIRYLYPLYFALPVVLTLIFLQIRKKSRGIFIAALLLILIGCSNAKGTWKSFTLVRKAHHNMKKIVNLMEESKNKFWFGEYWSAYVLTALSGEKIIVFPYSMHFYFPYELYYFNNREDQIHNLVFLREMGIYALLYKEELEAMDKEWIESKFRRVGHFIRLLAFLNIQPKIEKIDESILVYGIRGTVPHNGIDASIPDSIPAIALDRIENAGGHLDLFFKKENIPEEAFFRLCVKIPNYSSAFRPITQERKEIKISLPIPEKNFIKIQYYLEYASLRIDYTFQELDYSLVGHKLNKKEKRPFYLLSGFGPRVQIFGKKMLLCKKEVRLQLNTEIPEEGRLVFHLYSPLDFNQQFWYGKFSQEVDIYVNDVYVKKQGLEFGHNAVQILLPCQPMKEKKNVFCLKFKHSLPFGFAPFWVTASFLEKTEILSSSMKYTLLESKTGLKN